MSSWDRQIHSRTPDFQLDINPWSDRHTDKEIWDSFVDPLGFMDIAHYDEPEGVRAIWAFNAHLLGTGLAATVWGSEWAAYRILMMPVALAYASPFIGAYVLAGAYAGTSGVHGGVSPHSSGFGISVDPGLQRYDTKPTSSNPGGWDLGAWWNRVLG